MRLSQTQLIKLISKKYNYNQKDIKVIIDACKQEILESEEISFRGFAKFVKVMQKPRTVRIPSGKRIDITAKQKLIIKISASAKHEIQKYNQKA